MKTKEEKKVYFQNLRKSWQETKTLIENEQIKKEYEKMVSQGYRISGYGFAYVYSQLKRLNLEGLPLIDAKTYQGWIASGFQVKKGEKSRIKGITWILIDKNKSENDDNIDTYRIPREYHLFHSSQVEAIN